MPRTHSLTRRDFTASRSFRRCVGALLSLSFGILPSRKTPGGAIVVSKKVEKSAVGRNRIKRALRVPLYRYLRRGGCPSVIVTVRKRGDVSTLRDELESLLLRIPPLP